MSEQQNIEYKSSWHNDYLKWICGFANAQGGKIYISKDDAAQFIPLKDRKVVAGSARPLNYEDIEHYQKIIFVLNETDRLMKEIDLIL
jgi:predicted HTH transcriptional regulator